MAEQILLDFVENILLSLGSQALQQFGLAWGVTKELRKLENTVSTVKNILMDAEEQQVTNRAVREWLQRLKSIIYDVDDLVDEFESEVLLRQVKTRRSIIRKVCYFLTQNPFKIRYRIGSEIRDITERLDEIVADMKKFEFVVKVVERKVEVREREETYSFVRSSEVIGRESDKDALVQLLMLESNEENVSIIPIVGMGGLGKTTLAQFVYNDERVVAEFHQRLWVCISDYFDIKSIAVKILKAGGDSGCDSLGIEQLQSRLRQKLKEGDFLLVLDDVWNEDLVEWTKLRDLLMVGSCRCRILVTTRSTKTASIIGTVPSYHLRGLSDDDCLSVLVKWAFKDADGEKHPNLVSIGKEIVKKCGGVPLAARTLGGLLYSKLNEPDWLSVCDNEMWEFVQKENDILPILRLSYDQMPSYLKQCFAYCALFRKDQEIDKWNLIYLWMAQGFIKSPVPSEELEDIGEHYFNELMRRSFIHKDKSECYKMHDLVHDLAQYVAGSECFTVKSNATATYVPEGVRHVSFTLPASFPLRNFQEFPESLLKVKKLRTIMSPENGFSNGFRVISAFRNLRVLDLNFCLDQVPSRFGDLKHLRYLNMAGDYTTLPMIVSMLLNLQYLTLECPYLLELPQYFGDLINLRYLSLSSRSLVSLSEKGVGGLTSLRTLEISRSFSLMSLPEGIQCLTHLRSLEINDCSKLTSLPSGVRYLTALQHLKIESCRSLKFSDDDLQGLRNLKFLTLCDLPGLVSLPKGLQDAAPKLNQLVIWYCGNLNALPNFFTDLTSLQTLDIVSCPRLLSLPEGMQRLTSLQSLYISYCPYLSTRCRKEVGEDWQKISHVPELHLD